MNLSEIKGSSAVKRVAIASLGAIGRVVARALAKGEIAGFTLAAVSASNQVRAQQWLDEQGIKVPVVAIDALEPLSDVVLECAPAALLTQILSPFLEAGKEAIVLSAGALLLAPQLIEQAKRTGAVIRVPSGALVGLDGVLAAAQGQFESVRLVTRKAPGSYAGAPHVVKNQIDLEGMTQATCIFEGDAREAAQAFPANVNVVAALALTGAGPENTRMEVWADPVLTRNTHTITVVSDAAKMTMTMESLPSPNNPKTAMIVAQSVLALLKKQTAHLQMGT